MQLDFHKILYLSSNNIQNGTGKSVSEALILESLNPHYDDRLFMELRVQYEKNTISEQVRCVHKLF